MGRITHEETNRIYAYRTDISTTRSIEEVRHILDKFGAKAFAFATYPEKEEEYIGFLLETKFGKLQVRIDIPRIYLKNSANPRGKYLEKESYRALVLLVKAKLQQIDLGEPIEVVFFQNLTAGARAAVLAKAKELLPFNSGNGGG